MEACKKSIIVESLFPEIANLFGDRMNIHYLKECMAEAKFIDTSLTDQPAFLSKEVSMIYMGPMTEIQQTLAIHALKPHKEKLVELIDKGCVFLLTGNAMEVFEAYIENEDGSRVEGLGIFPQHAKRDMLHRYNSLILGEYEGIRLVGFKAQFSHTYGDNTTQYFYKVIRGCGIHPSSMLEGLRKNHFFGTYTVGPFLLLNPLFVKYLLSLLGIKNPVLAHEETIMAAYQKRLAEFENEKLKYE